MIPIIDMHCDTVPLAYACGRHVAAGGGSTLWGRDEFYSPEERKQGISLRSNARMVDFLRMKQAGYLCQSFSLYTNLGQLQKTGENVYCHALALSDLLDAAVRENGDIISLALTGSDMENNYREGRLSALKTVEEGAVFEGSLDKLAEFYRRGVRKATLTWNYPNELAYPNGRGNGPDGNPQTVVDEVNGLTPVGFEFIRAMENMGMLIDISHLNDAGIRDVFSAVKSRTPVIASHSNARGVCMHPRNLSDEMIRQIADHGGVSGINFCPSFLNSRYVTALRESECDSRVEDMIAHIRYFRNKGGIDMIALGSDFDGIGGNLEIRNCGEMQKLPEALDRAGFTLEEIEKICYKNALRVYKDVLG